jgi:formaldehyde-activating enzyme involved in methanogenesis
MVKKNKTMKVVLVFLAILLQCCELNESFRSFYSSNKLAINIFLEKKGRQPVLRMAPSDDDQSFPPFPDAKSPPIPG